MVLYGRGAVLVVMQDFERGVQEMQNEASLPTHENVVDGVVCFGHERFYLKARSAWFSLFGFFSVVDGGMGLTVYLKSVKAGRVPDEFCV